MAHGFLGITSLKSSPFVATVVLSPTAFCPVSTSQEPLLPAKFIARILLNSCEENDFVYN
jgi:hypothetical protein